MLLGDSGGIGINYSEYFNQTSSLVVVTPSNSNYSPDDISEHEFKIMTRISGGDRFYRNEENQVSVAERVYKTLYPVKIKDILNGQVVVYVKPIYEFDGSLAYYKVYV